MHERDVADDIGQLDSGRFSLLGRQDLDRDQTVRRAFIVPLQLRMFRDDGWHADWFWLRFALFVLAEAALIFPFLETRLSLWWSFVPGFALAGWLGYHLLPSRDVADTGARAAMRERGRPLDPKRGIRISRIPSTRRCAIGATLVSPGLLGGIGHVL
jgi:hypothetical protein